MKKSGIAVLSALGFILLMMFIVMGLGRIAVGSAVETRDGKNRSGSDDWGESVTRTADLDGFNGIIIDGAWELRVSEAEDFSVEIEYPEGVSFENLVSVKGGTLVLGGPEAFGGHDEDFIARIEMPELTVITIDGAGDAVFSGFDEETITVVIDGAGRVKGIDSSARNIDVRLRGLGQVDLEDLDTVNAEVRLEGAGEVRVNMNGGVLDGRLEGLGTIRYSGEVSEQRIDVEGLGQVKRIG